MSKLWGWVQEHPYEAGGILAVVLLGIVFLTGGFRSSASAAPASANNSQSAALQTQLQLAQISAGVATTQANNALRLGEDSIAASAQIAALSVDRDKTLAGLAAGVQTAGLTAQQTIATQSIAASKDVQIAGINANVTVNSTNNSTLVDLAHIVATMNQKPPAQPTLDNEAQAYLSANSDVLAYWNANRDPNTGSLTFDKPGGGTETFTNINDFALDHYNTYGMKEGRTSPLLDFQRQAAATGQ